MSGPFDLTPYLQSEAAALAASGFAARSDRGTFHPVAPLYFEDLQKAVWTACGTEEDARWGVRRIVESRDVRRTDIMRLKLGPSGAILSTAVWRAPRAGEPGPCSAWLIAGRMGSLIPADVMAGRMQAREPDWLTFDWQARWQLAEAVALAEEGAQGVDEPVYRVYLEFTTT